MREFGESGGATAELTGGVALGVRVTARAVDSAPMRARRAMRSARAAVFAAMLRCRAARSAASWSARSGEDVLRVVAVGSARRVGEAVVEVGGRRLAATMEAGEPKMGGRSFDLSVEFGEAGEAAERPTTAVVGVFTTGDFFAA